MKQELAIRDRQDIIPVQEGEKVSLVTLMVGPQLFGIPILKIQDILIPDAIYPVPLSPFQVAGSINQRGRVVTLIDARKRLGIRAPKSKQNNKKVCVIFMHESEIYGILVDKVGDVMELDKSLFENTPHTLKPEWKEVCVGVYRTEQALLLELDMEKFVKLEPGGDEIRN